MDRFWPNMTAALIATIVGGGFILFAARARLRTGRMDWVSWALGMGFALAAFYFVIDLASHG